MKSITVTTHRAINYGAVLQSFALQKAQQDLGVDNYLLDYPKSRFYPYIHWKNFPQKRTLIDIYLYVSTLLNRKKKRKLYDSFDSFVENNIKIIGGHGAYNYKKNPPFADFYLTGSDQVFDCDKSWLQCLRNLQFVPNGYPKFSYAASLGSYDWSKNQKIAYSAVLNEFSGISVREEYAKDFLSEFVDKDISVNIDPVFLLDKEKWTSYAKEPRIKGKYVLCFPLLNNDNMQSVLKFLKKKYGCKSVVVSTYASHSVKADKYIFDASPEEFLGLIKNAEAVVTTSFHGTALSALFEKDFYCLTKEYKSQRMVNLLDMLNLSERIIKTKDDVERIKTLKAPDYKKCRETIESERQRSMDYLKSCIDTVRDNRR